MMNRISTIILITLAFHVVIRADGPEDNDPLSVRPIPPVGITVDPARRTAMLDRCAVIRRQLAELGDTVNDQWKCQVEVFPRAVEMTLQTKMFYAEKDLKAAGHLLDEAQRRTVALREGRSQDVLKSFDHPRLIVGGFRSKIDGSVQPFGLEMPESGREPSANEGDQGSRFRLDVWLHGRGEKSSEVGFLNQRSKQASQYAPANTIVLHPYGRYSNAFKFAGEIDVIEAIEHVQDLFPVDSTRVAIRGFSMGGAGCWQLAVHYPDRWTAANPGAGFSETRQFLSFFQLQDFKPTWYQEKLLHWYDCPDWTNNLRQVPTIAYSGEIDRQKQAADVMVAAFRSRGMTLPHIIGPNTGHKIHPDSKITVQAQLDAALDQGKQSYPSKIDLTTYTLRYHRIGWLSVEGLEEHWKEARVQAALEKNSSKSGSAQPVRIVMTTSNVNRMAIEFSTNHFAPDAQISVLVDRQSMSIRSQPDGSVVARLTKTVGGEWTTDHEPSSRLVKRPGLQGPIDDAFMDAFTFIGPDAADDGAGQSVVGKWVDAEYRHAKNEWKRHFRGDIVEATPDEVDDDVMASRHLILFGTPKTNTLIARIADKLPIRWEDDGVRVGQRRFQGNHLPLLIYPNPLNPDRYVVLNSGFTYREFAYLNNARQIPMLPDWAVVDVSEGSTTQSPGEIKAAGFFDENWQIKKKESMP